jgi:hypothetical protein
MKELLSAEVIAKKIYLMRRCCIKFTLAIHQYWC